MHIVEELHEDITLVDDLRGLFSSLTHPSIVFQGGHSSERTLPQIPIRASIRVHVHDFYSRERVLSEISCHIRDVLLGEIDDGPLGIRTESHGIETISVLCKEGFEGACKLRKGRGCVPG